MVLDHTEEAHVVKSETPEQVAARTGEWPGDSHEDGEAEAEKPKAKIGKTREQLMEQIDGLQMRCESLITMIDALRKQNHKLSVTAQKAVIKADAYKEMVHEVLVSNVSDHQEEFENGSSQDAGEAGPSYTTTFPSV
jgi:hypothetical protein